MDRRSDPQVARSWPERLVEAGALFLLVFSPLAFGTVDAWSEAVVELVVLVIALICVLGMLRDWELRAELPPGWLPAALFLALIFVRTIPLSVIGSATRSLDPYSTWREGLKLLAVSVFFLVCYNTYRSEAQTRRALWTMVLTGTGVSLFGIVQRATWNGFFYWVGPRAPIHSSPFGPFVNRAHFAGLMVIVVPAALAFVFGVVRHRRQRRSGRRWADVLREWSTETDASRLMPVFIVVMGGAALLSGSRGGLVALIVALFMMLGGLWAQGRPGRGGVGRVGLAALLIVLTAVWIGSDILYGTVERLAEEIEQPAESLRVRIWADAFNLWRAAPLFGTGFATFEFAFPRFRTVQAPVVFSHAESDWIQLLTDTGLVGFGLVVAFVVCLASALLRRYRTAESRWTRAFGLAGLVALAATIIHGAANYNIPVMANFLYLALVLALAHP